MGSAQCQSAWVERSAGGNSPAEARVVIFAISDSSIPVVAALGSLSVGEE